MHYKKGHMIEAGGLADQPNWYVDAMSQCIAVYPDKQGGACPLM